MECLAYATQKWKEVTGKPSPSSSWYPGEFWRNAEHTTSGIRVPGIAIWINNKYTDRGHALFIAASDSRTHDLTCYEANWDYNGNTRIIYRTPEELKAMYDDKIWKGCVY